MFDEKSCQALQHYVYMLIDPRDNLPFYVGKGTNNRLFEHLACAPEVLDAVSAKYDTINDIIKEGLEVRHVVVRHGLASKELAYEIEASLIDTLLYSNLDLKNMMGGHHSSERGLMTSDEIRRKYNAEQLDEIGNDCVLININKQYDRWDDQPSIYIATKETWAIDQRKLKQIRYVLSEYRGLVVEVFEVEEWYPSERGYLEGTKKFGKVRIGYGFNGRVAPEHIRNMYINKSVKESKGKGSRSAIRYNLKKGKDQ